MKGLVEYQASGLVFMPGWRGEQASLVGTPLEELCPVVIDPARPDGSASEGPRRLVLTEAGRKSLLTKLADSGPENLAVWESLPGGQWYGPVLRAKAGSEVLAVHEDAANEYGRIPLLVTRTFGSGKVLYMATTAPGGGGRASRTNTTTGSGARWSAGWPTAATWPGGNA